MDLLKTKTNKILVSVALGLIFSVLLSFARFDALCCELRENVLRLHILANSDSEEDQSLKLLVRDAVLEECGYLFETNTTLQQAITSANNNIDLIKNVAKNTVLKNGYDYDVKVSVCADYFNTREYDDFTLPAGVYDAVKIEIGSAQGKNWWCVMFPSVCVYSAANTEKSNKTKLESATSKSSAYIAENSEKFIIRFKVVEIYEQIKKYFNK